MALLPHKDVSEVEGDASNVCAQGKRVAPSRGCVLGPLKRLKQCLLPLAPPAGTDSATGGLGVVSCLSPAGDSNEQAGLEPLF